VRNLPRFCLTGTSNRSAFEGRHRSVDIQPSQITGDLLLTPKRAVEENDQMRDPIDRSERFARVLGWFIGFCCVLVSLSAGEEWKALWDGKTFQGWHTIGKGEWRIEDGAIHGLNRAGEEEFGHLVTDQSYSDFTIQLKFKALKGNSGLYFRIEEKGFSGVSGFQAEIDAEKDVGGLYETNGRGWVLQPKPEDVNRWFKRGEWNEMTVTAKGRNITVTVNGQKSAELHDNPGRTSGRLALQVHGGQDCDVWFKDLKILTD
jgi:hypothetical protein